MRSVGRFFSVAYTKDNGTHHSGRRRNNRTPADLASGRPCCRTYLSTSVNRSQCDAGMPMGGDTFAQKTLTNLRTSRATPSSAGVPPPKVPGSSLDRRMRSEQCAIEANT